MFNRNNLYPMLWFCLASILWVFPLVVIGAKIHIPEWLPHRLRMQASCAALFTNRNVVWGQPIYMVKVSGQNEWIEISRSLISPLEIAGYRTRPDRFIQEAEKRGNLAMLKRFCSFIASSYEAAFPEAKVEAVKVYRGIVNVSQSPADVYSGRWVMKSYKQLNTKDLKLIVECAKVGQVWNVVKSKSGQPTETHSKGTENTTSESRSFPTPVRSPIGRGIPAPQKAPVKTPQPLILKNAQNSVKPFVRPQPKPLLEGDLRK